MGPGGRFDDLVLSLGRMKMEKMNKEARMRWDGIWISILTRCDVNLILCKISESML